MKLHLPKNHRWVFSLFWILDIIMQAFGNGSSQAKNIYENSPKTNPDSNSRISPSLTHRTPTLETQIPNPVTNLNSHQNVEISDKTTNLIPNPNASNKNSDKNPGNSFFQPMSDLARKKLIPKPSSTPHSFKIATHQTPNTEQKSENELDDESETNGDNSPAPIFPNNVIKKKLGRPFGKRPNSSPSNSPDISLLLSPRTRNRMTNNSPNLIWG